MGSKNRGEERHDESGKNRPTPNCGAKFELSKWVSEVSNASKLTELRSFVYPVVPGELWSAGLWLQEVSRSSPAT